MRVIDSLVFVVMVTIVSVSGKIPDGFVLKVTVDCGVNDTQVAVIRVVSDLYVTAHAECVGQHDFEFFSSDSINFVLHGGFNDARPYCQFFRRENTDVFTVPVFVQWGSPSNTFQMNEEHYTVICTFNGRGNGNSNFQDVVEALVAPRVIQSNMGEQSNSSFTLRLTDILGGDLEQPIHAGRLVKLVATADNSSGAVGLRALSCDAIGSVSNTKFSIIRAGCGDGLVIQKTAGFITSGLTSISPPFQSFTLFNDHDIRFDCNFTMCLSNCDGSSCATERRKRAMADAGSDYVPISTNQLSFASTTNDTSGIDTDEVSPIVRQKNYTGLTVGHWIFICMFMALATALVATILCGNDQIQQNNPIATRQITKVVKLEIKH